MVRPIKKKQIQNLQDVIKETAWKQIAEQSAAALSLRAIARELKITAPAIYHYFPNRDALIAALIVDAFNSFAHAQEVAVKKLPADDLSGKLFALGMAYHEWAVTYPQRYQLVFGTPVPDYQVPGDVTLTASARALKPLIKAVHDISSAGRLRAERLAPATPKLASMLNAWSASEGGFDPEVVYLVLAIWSRVHGLVWLEIGNHFPAFLDDPAELFRREMNNILNQYL